MPESLRSLAEAGHLRSHRESIVVEPSVAARSWWLIRRAFVAAYEDNCFGIAKGAAYSLLLSLFPILTTLTSILLSFRAQSVVQVMARVIRQFVPSGAENLLLARLIEHNGRPISLPVLSIVLSLWAGSGAMITLMEGFEAAYRIPTSRPFHKQRSMAIFLVLIVATPAVAASALIIFGNRIESALIHWIGVADVSSPVEVLWRVSRYVLAFCTTTFVTGLLYYFGPNHRPEPKRPGGARRSRFLHVWPGAFLATTLWLMTTGAFAWYVSHVANYNLFYGSLVAVIVLLIWLYLISCIVLIGCEYNAERERADSIASVL